jgi:holo-[acyl-carrier protein] synthase
VIVGVGLDVIPIARIATMLERYGSRMEERLFTPRERAYCRSRGLPEQHFAVRFAAKEALLKALGAPPGLRWREIEVLSGVGGAPELHLSGAAALAAAARGVVKQHVSLTHAGDVAAAVVVLERGP